MITFYAKESKLLLFHMQTEYYSLPWRERYTVLRFLFVGENVLWFWIAMALKELWKSSFKNEHNNYCQSLFDYISTSSAVLHNEYNIKIQWRVVCRSSHSTMICVRIFKGSARKTWLNFAKNYKCRYDYKIVTVTVMFLFICILSRNLHDMRDRMKANSFCTLGE